MIRAIQGQISAHILYPLVERHEKRAIRTKWAELRAHYQLSWAERQVMRKRKLVDMLRFAIANVPYYRDVAALTGFDVDKLEKDFTYLSEFPYLTKDIIREQGERLLSRHIAEVRHHLCKTGGSTGLPCHIYYDQEAADYAAAVILFAREHVGKAKSDFEVHFASRFPDVFPWRDRVREHVKCLAMNRANIFFDKLDDIELEQMWQRLRGLKSKMVHAHPSTIYALACYIERTRGKAKAFDIFESSGELLEEAKRAKIENALQCKVIDRYGLAEFGVIAYQLKAADRDMLILDSEGWAENADLDDGQEAKEIVFTGFHNHLMPLIRYRTGDCGTVVDKTDGQYLTAMTGRMHDMISVNGTVYPTHYVQDVLDRVGGILEFQIDLGVTPPRLLIVLEQGADQPTVEKKLREWWGEGMDIVFGTQQDIVRVGWRSKFRHVVGG